MSMNEAEQSRLDTVSLADEEAVKHILVSTVFGLWDIVNNLTRLRPSKRERYRVTIPQCVNTADDAVALIREAHALWARGTTA